MSEGTTPTPPPPTPQQHTRGRRRWCSCERCQRRGLMGPAVLITVGVIFLLAEFSRRFDFGDLWPLILIVIGVIKLLEYGASTEGHQG